MVNSLQKQQKTIQTVIADQRKKDAAINAEIDRLVAIDVEMCRELADALGGQLAFTRPMVENGFGDTAHQIGLSGRTVRPKLIITCGVSGAIQFTSCMKASECIVAINNDPEAQIFKAAHY